MSKHKKNKRASKPKIEVYDLPPQNDPKAGDKASEATMLSRLMQMAHDMRKAIIANFRA